MMELKFILTVVILKALVVNINCKDNICKANLNMENKFVECFERNVDLTEIHQHLVASSNETSRNAICGKWKELRRCFPSYSAYVAICLDEQERKKYENAVGVLEGFGAFICEYNNSYSLRGDECASERTTDVELCVPFYNSQNWTFKDVETNPKIRSEFLTQVYKTSNCNVYHNFSECIEAALSQCPNGRDYFKRLFYEILISNNCFDVLNAIEPYKFEHIFLVSLIPKRMTYPSVTCPNGKTGFENARSKIGEAYQCWKSELDTGEFVNDLLKGGKNEIQIRNYCPKFANLIRLCLSNFTDFFLPCAQRETDNVILNTGKSVIETAYDFVCVQNEDKIQRLVEEFHCLRSKSLEFYNSCVRWTDSKFASVGFDENYFDNVLPYRQYYDDQDCKHIRGLDYCLISNPVTCDDGVSVKLIKELALTLTMKTPCLVVEYPPLLSSAELAALLIGLIVLILIVAACVARKCSKSLEDYSTFNQI